MVSKHSYCKQIYIGYKNHKLYFLKTGNGEQRLINLGWLAMFTYSNILTYVLSKKNVWVLKPNHWCYKSQLYTCLNPVGKDHLKFWF